MIPINQALAIMELTYFLVSLSLCLAIPLFLWFLANEKKKAEQEHQRLQKLKEKADKELGKKRNGEEEKKEEEEREKKDEKAGQKDIVGEKLDEYRKNLERKSARELEEKRNGEERKTEEEEREKKSEEAGQKDFIADVATSGEERRELDKKELTAEKKEEVITLFKICLKLNVWFSES